MAKSRLTAEKQLSSGWTMGRLSVLQRQTRWLGLCRSKSAALGRIVLCALFGTVAFCGQPAAQEQHDVTTPVYSYQGQTVSSVTIAGQPDPALVPQVELVQKPNQPYSQQKVDETVANLKKSGKVQDVKVEVTPEAKGLRVLFVLQPTYYFGVFQFPEATNKFSYTRLLQVADYSRQDPYARDHVAKALGQLADFFHENGYFLATVEPELQVDQKNRVVNVIFLTRLKRRAHFGDIRVTGMPAADAQTLQRSLRSMRARIRGASLKSGSTYSHRRLERATAHLRAEMGKRQYLASQVQLLAPEYDPATNRADITFHVTPGPRIAIEILGAKVSGKTRKKLIPIYQENTVDADLVREGEDNLASYFQSKGFFDAHVTSRMEHHSPSATVTYNVTRGKRGRVKALDFQGNQHFSDKDLAVAVPVQKARWWWPFSHGKFSQSLARTSARRIQGLYRAAGYSQVNVNSEVVRKNGDVHVVFRVNEGVRDVVEELELQGNNSLPLAQLAPKGLNLAAGKPYSQQLQDKDRDQIMATYLQQGFLNATFLAKATPLKDDPHRVTVVYSISEGPQVFAKTVTTVGAVHTRTDTIKTNADIKAGRPLSLNSLLQAESQLMGLDVFDWSSVDTREPVTDQSDADVLVKVHEAKRNTISYGFGFEVTNRGGAIPNNTVALPGLPPVGVPSNFVTSEATFWGPRGSIEYTRTNLFGRAQSMSLNALAGRLDQRASGNWLDPSFWNSAWIATASVSAERSSQNPLFTSGQGQAGLNFERFLDAKRTKTLYLRYSFSVTNLTNLLTPELVLPEDRHVRLSTFSASYSRDTRDNILDAHKGMYQSLEAFLTPEALGANTNFGRVLGQVAYYAPFKGLVWANSVRVGVEESFGGAHIPLSENFFSGGGSTLRGFPLNGAGPQRPVAVCGNPSDPATCALISVPAGGHQLLILNSELRFPLKIMSKLSGAIFYDGGNVFRSVGFGHFADQYTNSVGGGIRYSTPLGPIRLDIGHLVTPIPGVKSTQVFITLGQAF
jgi:outer membrane protein insertion porin family